MTKLDFIKIVVDRWKDADMTDYTALVMIDYIIRSDNLEYLKKVLRDDRETTADKLTKMV